MEAIERAAHLSVGRACGFCGLAILCFMVGFSSDPHLAARVGGIFALLVCVVLLVKAKLAQITPYKRTETWLILQDQDRPSAVQAQKIIGDTLRQVYVVYAWYSAVTAAALISFSIILGVLLA